MGLFVLSFFPRGVLDEIWDLIEFLRVFLPTLQYLTRVIKNEKKSNIGAQRSYFSSEIS